MNYDISAYVDGNGLLAPRKVLPGEIQASDNGPMFSSEWAIIEHRNLLNETRYKASWGWRISRCMYAGLLFRTPDPLNKSQTGPDDYYGVLAASKELGYPLFANRMLKALIAGRGCLNNEVINKWSWKSFLIRQPQLLAAMFSAAGYRTILLGPLYIIAAVVIATSCMFTPATKENANPRRLAWLLIQAVVCDSYVCFLAAKIWYKRLNKQYGVPNAMYKVAEDYYEKGHPFVSFFKNEPEYGYVFPIRSYIWTMFFIGLVAGMFFRHINI